MIYDINPSIRSKIWFHDMQPVIDELNIRNINYALIKGEALSWYVYGSIGKRISNDIDLLTDRSQLNLIDSILKNYGFDQYVGENIRATRSDIISSIINSHQTISYRKVIEPYKIHLEVDVNFSVFWGENRELKLDTKDLLDHYIYLNVYGAYVKVLSPSYAFIQVILHHYKDCNSLYLLYTRKSINHQMFREIYLFWNRYKKCISLEWLYTYSESTHITEYVFYMLFYTNYIYKDKTLCKYVDALRTDRGEQLLNSYGLDEVERRHWNVSFDKRILTDSIKLLIENDLTDNDRKKINYSMNLF